LLEVALCQQANGTYATLAWCAAGRPERGIEHRDTDAYSLARAVVHANGGSIRPDDERKLLERLRRCRRAAQ
jgi:hypothetical protein